MLTTSQARVLNGFGTGILTAITPVWATEIASHESRGAFGKYDPNALQRIVRLIHLTTVAMEFTLNIFGVVVAYWLE